MTKIEKFLERIRNNPKAVRFDDLAKVMERAGFALETRRGSHVKFTKAGRATIVGVIPHGGRNYADVALVEDCLDALE